MCGVCEGTGRTLYPVGPFDNNFGSPLRLKSKDCKICQGVGKIHYTPILIIKKKKKK